MDAALEFRPVEVELRNVETWRVAVMMDKLIKVNKRLAKVGAPAATLTRGEKVTVTRKDEWGFERTWDEYKTVTLTGVEAKLAGWTGVASLDHSIGGVEAFVTAFPGHEGELPDYFRTRGPVCDHCNVSIKTRKLTIVFVDDTGKFVQVGRQCVIEYLGVDPSLALWLATSLPTDEDDGEPRHSMSRYVASPAEFLACAAEATRINGFTSTQFHDRYTTKNQALDLCYDRLKRDELGKDFPGLDMKRGMAAAAAIMEWVLASTEDSDFMCNARTAAAAPRTSDRTVGLLAALPQSYAKAMERKVEAEIKAKAKDALPASEHVGTVGEKVTVEATVTFHMSWPSDYPYGPDTHRVNFVTADGVKLTVKGSSQSLVDLTVGDLVSLTGKVKEHEDSEQYGKCTRLWHVKAKVLAEAVAA